NWLTKEQQEPLEYDLGRESGKRECSINSGGIWECFRILFHALNKNLIKLPARILTFGIELPVYLKNFSHLEFNTLSSNEELLTEEIKAQFIQNNAAPTYFLIGKNLREETRRNLRLLSLENPLFFIEANEAPNHLSLAREAKMMNRVVRYISPAVLSPLFSELSLVFVAGNSEYLKTLDAIHFQLKGTPASAEAELLTFLLKNNFHKKNGSAALKISSEPSQENVLPTTQLGSNFYTHTKIISNKISDLIESKTKVIDGRINSILEKGESLTNK
ncbi:MAG: hypothetical protein NTY86_06805, partial [Deltaproteobacteria bacterium]|nr:hypothetical protein [Deltaproteobacteria bacterium]